MVGNFPVLVFPWVNMPTEVFRGTGERVEISIPREIDILELTKKYYLGHKETLLKKYKGKYIAILNNWEKRLGTLITPPLRGPI